MDKQLGSLRGARWAKAFSKKEEDGHDPEQSFEQRRRNVNRKATIVIEHLIQASDVAHTMQHWHVYKVRTYRYLLLDCLLHARLAHHFSFVTAL